MSLLPNDSSGATGPQRAVRSLAHLQLGRARVISGDREGARKDYQGFFTLWKDAGPDIPILKEAKAEYVKLQ